MQSLQAAHCSILAAPNYSSRRLRLRALASSDIHTATSLIAPSTGTGPKDAVLCTKFKAHDAAISALAVLQDKPGMKRIITASLDKTLQQVTLEGCDLGGPQLTATKVEVAGGPVFSLHPAMKPKITDANTKPRPVIFCGLAAKEIAAWQPDSLTFNEQVRMNGHTGWVRSLASSGKYLFSCGCNHLRQWDQAYAVPKQVSSTKLFTGDILAIACADKQVFTAGADGSLRAWKIGKLGELTEAGVREKAHDGRITSLLVHGSLLYSAGYDGSIKAWDCSSLKLVLQVKAAHKGERVRALVIGPVSTPASSSSSSSSSTNSPTDITSISDSSLAGASVPVATTEVAEANASSSGECPAAGSAGPALSPSPAASAGSGSGVVLYSGGDDMLVRRWDVRLLTPAGAPLQVHTAAVKALAAGDKETLVSGDAAGEVAVWVV